MPNGLIALTFRAVSGFAAVTALGAGVAKAQYGYASIVAWGNNSYGQFDVPEPNTDFAALAAGGFHSLGLRVYTAGDVTGDLQNDVITSNWYTDNVSVLVNKYLVTAPPGE